MKRAWTFVAALAALLAGAGTAAAQNYTVTSTPGALGNVAAAASGTTSFVINADGTVTASGGGARVTAGSAATRALVTVACGNQASCDTDTPQVTIAATGTPTGRAAALTSFNVVMNTAVLSGAAPATGNSIVFNIGPVGKGLSKSFYVIATVPIRGDENSGIATGSASSGFAITVKRGSNATTFPGTGSFTATVFRRLSIAKTSDLSFGRLIRPSSGTGSASLLPGGASVSVSGTGAVALASPTPTSAVFSIGGEGGQAISVSVPATFVMTGSAGSITVTTNSTGAGSQTLTGAIGTAQALTTTVGGSFPLNATTATGSYSGNFTVIAQYN